MLIEKEMEGYKVKKIITPTYGEVDSIVVTRGLNINGPIFCRLNSVHVGNCVIYTEDKETARRLLGRINTMLVNDK
jgi:hypothetical protein